MLIDTHAHVNFAAFKDDADETIRRALDNDTWMILVGSELKTSNRALNYANKYEKGVYAAVGLHPVHLQEGLVESGDEDLAWKYFQLGLIISFTGLITFSRNWDSLIRKTPLDKVMIETDSPYMTPEPYRGQRNEPVLVQYVAQRVAEIKGIKIEKVIEETTATAKNLFKI